MPKTLAIDVGSSSVKAAVLEGTAIVGDIASASFETDHAGVRVEVPVHRIEAALRQAVTSLDLPDVERVGLTSMSPAWLAMDEEGDALTPVVTHQDRRSLEEARRIEREVGRDEHLRIAGNRPTPGGISSTTTAWFAKHTGVIKRAATVAHLPTYLIEKLTGRRVVDPSNASFMGFLDVHSALSASPSWQWSETLVHLAGLRFPSFHRSSMQARFLEKPDQMHSVFLTAFRSSADSWTAADRCSRAGRRRVG